MEYSHTQVVQEAMDDHGFIRWLGEENFLDIGHRTCDNCEGPMRLAVYDGCIDGFCMRCNDSNCHGHQSIRRGSFFEHGHLPLSSVLHILIGFVHEAPASCTSRDYNIKYSAVLDYYRKARMRWSQDIREHPITFEGNSEYEVDEMHARYVSSVADLAYHECWIGGILERRTGRVKLYFLPSRSKEDVTAPIKESVPKGALVYTDELRSYSCLSELRTPYEHYTVNHSVREYKRAQDIGGGEVLSVHINGMESLFSRLRGKLKYPSRAYRDTIQFFLDEMMYRRSGRSLYNSFKMFPSL